MSNLKLYDAVRSVPENAKKRITGGRLSGMTDINPMWRIKTLTEQFGICGIGWKYVITDKRLEQGANGEIAAFVDIDLYIKIDDEWSEPIPGNRRKYVCCKRAQRHVYVRRVLQDGID